MPADYRLPGIRLYRGQDDALIEALTALLEGQPHGMKNQLIREVLCRGLGLADAPQAAPVPPGAGGTMALDAAALGEIRRLVEAAVATALASGAVVAMPTEGEAEPAPEAGEEAFFLDQLANNLRLGDD